MTTGDTAAFVGWHRSGSMAPWHRLSEGRTYAEALNRLLDLAPDGDVLVLPSGRDPVQPTLHRE